MNYSLSNVGILINIECLKLSKATCCGCCCISPVSPEDDPQQCKSCFLEA